MGAPKPLMTSSELYHIQLNFPIAERIVKKQLVKSVERTIQI